MNEVKPQILYAEDDLNLATVTRDHLDMNGFEVTYVADGESAIKAFDAAAFKLVILDVVMPSLSGFEVAQHIRKVNDHVPILFITAKSLKEDKLEGFKVGADDYILKPYSIEELLYKLRVFLKRSSIDGTSGKSNTTLQLGKFIFNYAEQTLLSEGTLQSLTHKESEVLKILINSQGQVVKRDDVLLAVWGNDDYFNGRSLDVFISKLRKKLQNDPRIEIMNVFAIGFKLLVKN